MCEQTDRMIRNAIWRRDLCLYFDETAELTFYVRDSALFAREPITNGASTSVSQRRFRHASFTKVGHPPCRCYRTGN